MFRTQRYLYDIFKIPQNLKKNGNARGGEKTKKGRKTNKMEN
jgi:hypothetical protein